ncbi:iron chaperone [Aldersonia kunmingensis]|uniref:iron chaperone n=1 Tax=Aldersonia kunmingensis TaxID=408066 RepID=UPI000A6DCD1C|nr:DUF1801 domain-containing protein [Aldersonia kunmingensis]
MTIVGTIDEYLAGLEPEDRTVIEHIYAVAREVEPAAEQGKSYGMPALTLRGKGLIAVMRTKKHIGLYPFSGEAVTAVGSLLDGVDADKGTVRFQPADPISDDAVRALVTFRRDQIG